MAATYKRASVERALQAKGFRRRESHHSYFVYYTEAGAKTPVQTKTSHGKGSADIPNNLFGRMARQCKLRTVDFRDFVECSLSQADYEARLMSDDEI